MICPKCGNHVIDDARFCTHCGTALKKCVSCGRVNIGGSNFCVYCGRSMNFIEKRVEPSLNPYGYPEDAYNRQLSSMNQEHTVINTQTVHNQPKETVNQESRTFENNVHFDDAFTKIQNPSHQNTYSGNYVDNVFNDYQNNSYVPPRERVKWKKVIIACTILIAATLGSRYYLMHSGPVKLNQTDGVSSKKGDLSKFSASELKEIEKYSNNNNDGLIDSDGKNIYMTDNNGYLVRLDNHFANKKVLADEKVSYIYLSGETLYYTNSSNQLCSMNKDGSNKQILVADKCFYIHPVNDKIYYQNDSQNESLAVYDINTKKSEILVNRHVYAMNIHDQMIYYLTSDAVYSYHLTDKKDTLLVKESAISLIYKDNKIYYLNKSGELIVYDKQTQRTLTLIRSAYSFVMNDQYIYYVSGNGSLYQYDINTKVTVLIHKLISMSSSDYNIYLINNQILFKDNKRWTIVDAKSKQYTQVYKE